METTSRADPRKPTSARSSRWATASTQSAAHVHRPAAIVTIQKSASGETHMIRATGPTEVTEIAAAPTVVMATQPEAPG